MIRHNSPAPAAGRLFELDALRGVAALLVLLQHARVMGLDPRPFDNPLLERGGHMLMHFSPLRVLLYDGIVNLTWRRTPQRNFEPLQRPLRAPSLPECRC